MAIQIDRTPSPAWAARREGAPALVLVAGSGRSGTSLFSGLLQRLGFLVPAPEVPADGSNPRGFGESQWVVDFHTRLLRRVRVEVSDARPAAWALTAEAGLDPEIRDELRTWLRRQLRTSPDVIVKDPRLSWFLPLWRRCAADVGIDPRVVTLLRHPAAVVDSKSRWYGAAQSDVARVAGWLNLTLATERATRAVPRSFVLYDDLLEDWPSAVARVGRELDLAAVRDAPAGAIRSAHEFLDRSLSRSVSDWGQSAMPGELRALAEETWAALEPLAGATAEPGVASAAQLDVLRTRYQQLYVHAEAIAQSSIAAGHGPRSPRMAPTRAVRLALRVPVRYRHAVPLAWRRRLARAAGVRTTASRR